MSGGKMRKVPQRPGQTDDTRGVSNALHQAYDDLEAAHDERMTRLLEEMEKFVGSDSKEAGNAAD